MQEKRTIELFKFFNPEQSAGNPLLHFVRIKARFCVILTP